MNPIIISKNVAPGTPRKAASDLYLVDSTTATLVAYKVRSDRFGHWSCNCMAAYWNRPCKHVIAVLAEEAAVEAPELADDLAAIAEYLNEEIAQDFECSRVSNAKSTWGWDDGER